MGYQLGPSTSLGPSSTQPQLKSYLHAINIRDGCCIVKSNDPKNLSIRPAILRATYVTISSSDIQERHKPKCPFSNGGTLITEMHLHRFKKRLNDLKLFFLWAGAGFGCEAVVNLSVRAGVLIRM